MANEVQISISFRASKNGADVATNKAFRDDTSGTMTQATQTIGESYEVLDLGEVANPNQILISNLSADESVVLTRDVADPPFMTVSRGKTALFQPNGTPLYIKTSNGEVGVFVIAVASA